MTPLVALPIHERPTLVGLGEGHFGSLQGPVERSYLMHEVWSLHLYRYDAQFWYESEEFPLSDGFLTLVPPGTKVRYRWHRPSVHLTAFFQYGQSVQGRCPLPILVDARGIFERLWTDLDTLRPLEIQARERADIRLWDVLWQIAELFPKETTVYQPTTFHPAVHQIIKEIDANLAGSISVVQLAKSAGCSSTHLLRLIRASFGTSIVGLIRQRRAEAARRLLLHSDQSIAEIARQVGLEDPSYFSRTLKKVLGLTPGQLRGGRIIRTTVKSP